MDCRAKCRTKQCQKLAAFFQADLSRNLPLESRGTGSTGTFDRLRGFLPAGSQDRGSWICISSACSLSATLWALVLMIDE